MKELILLLVMLNPFAQVLYLFELMDKLKPGEFFKMHLKATLISFIIFVIFALIGEKYIMKEIFQVRLASLQIFGGIIILFIAFKYIIEGSGSNVLFRGDITDLAPNIALPYMIGPGTVWVSILIGRKFSFHFTVGIIFTVLFINFIFLMVYHQIHFRISNRKEQVVGKYFAILMRINALFIGAIAIEMMISGIESVIKNI